MGDWYQTSSEEQQAAAAMAGESAPLFQWYFCLHCKLTVSADDAESPTDKGTCLCRRCFARMRDEPRIPMTHAVYMDINDAVVGAEGGQYSKPEGSDWEQYHKSKRDLENPSADEMPE